MNRFHRRPQLAFLIVFTFLAIPPVGAVAATTGGPSLVFDPSAFTFKSLAVDGTTVTFRAYENIVCVKNPVDTRYETINIYIPTQYFEGKSVGSYNADTAPIFLPNSVGGYMPGPAGGPGMGRDGGANAALVALARGYVVAEPGARGRTNVDANGTYTGKAPAAIVDLKAAVRYLRFNDKVMPGNAEKIVSNGTSAGGALSALLGASGDNADYEPYLKALGAADTRDDIYAVSAYCPITNLDNADAAYEWLFNGINTYAQMSFQAPPSGADAAGMPVDAGTPPADGTADQGGPNGAGATQASLTPDQVMLSSLLKARFPAYLNSLGLKKSDGSALTVDANGNGSFRDYVKSFVIASAQKALKAGKDLTSLPWITIKSGVVKDINFDSYVAYATRMKTPPAFDAVDLSNPENQLFGTATTNALHFTQFGMDHTTNGGSLANSSIVKMMNAMNYIGTKGTTTAKYWRIRHGTADRDTSLAIPVMLATKLSNNGAAVDFAMPWAQPHSGDYDLDELFAWIAQVCK